MFGVRFVVKLLISPKNCRSTVDPILVLPENQGRNKISIFVGMGRIKNLGQIFTLGKNIKISDFMPILANISAQGCISGKISTGHKRVLNERSEWHLYMLHYLPKIWEGRNFGQIDRRFFFRRNFSRRNCFRRNNEKSRRNFFRWNFCFHFFQIDEKILCFTWLEGVMS